MTFRQWKHQALLSKAIDMAAMRVPTGIIAQELGYATHSAFSYMVTSFGW